MFIPHQPLPISAVRYFLPLSALIMLGAESASPDAIEWHEIARHLPKVLSVEVAVLAG